MSPTNLPLDSFLGHLAALPGRLPSLPDRAPPAAAVGWWPMEAADAPLAAALAGDLGAPWQGHDALAPGLRRLAAFLAAQDDASWDAGLHRLARDLADGRDAEPGEDEAARVACGRLGERHAFVATVFQALFEARSGLAMPAWAFAALRESEPAIHALALDVGRRTRLPAALAAHFHHRLEVALGKPQATPRFDELAALLAQRGASAS